MWRLSIEASNNKLRLTAGLTPVTSTIYYVQTEDYKTATG